jgi:hypothetical protein
VTPIYKKGYKQNVENYGGIINYSVKFWMANWKHKEVSSF